MSTRTSYTEAQLDALADHVRRQAYRAAPTSSTAAALIAARRKVAKSFGGSGDEMIEDLVKVPAARRGSLRPCVT